MSDYSDFKAQIVDYANRQDWPDSLVTAFVRQAESKFNMDLRVNWMIETAQNVTTGRCATLPDDWLEMEFVSIATPNVPSGFQPIRYKSRDEFFQLPDKWAQNYYTLEGRIITFGGCPDSVNGLTYQIVYYGEVPVFSDTQPSWVYSKHPLLYLFAALSNADLHAVGEEDKAIGLAQQVDVIIAKLNDQHRTSKASGSRLTRTRTRSFG